VVSRANFPTDQACERLQMWLRMNGSVVRSVKAMQKSDKDLPYLVYFDELGGSTQVVCELSQVVNRDLFAVGWKLRPEGGLKPPPTLPHLYLAGVRTVVVGEDKAELSRLREPWSSTGIFLVPVIKGLIQVTLSYYQRGVRRAW
jgi:hypothetical protein